MTDGPLRRRKRCDTGGGATIVRGCPGRVGTRASAGANSFEFAPAQWRLNLVLPNDIGLLLDGMLLLQHSRGVAERHDLRWK